MECPKTSLFDNLSPTFDHCIESTTCMWSTYLPNETNFKVWKEDVAIVLGCMDLDLALQVEKPILTLDNL
ncbi:hypothetical protein CR513_20547, partial [Mucuna pruriens]